MEAKGERVFEFFDAEEPGSPKPKVPEAQVFGKNSGISEGQPIGAKGEKTYSFGGDDTVRDEGDFRERRIGNPGEQNVKPSYVPGKNRFTRTYTNEETNLCSKRFIRNITRMLQPGAFSCGVLAGCMPTWVLMSNDNSCQPRFPTLAGYRDRAWAYMSSRTVDKPLFEWVDDRVAGGAQALMEEVTEQTIGNVAGQAVSGSITGMIISSLVRRTVHRARRM